MIINRNYCCKLVCYPKHSTFSIWSRKRKKKTHKIDWWLKAWCSWLLVFVRRDGNWTNTDILFNSGSHFFFGLFILCSFTLWCIFPFQPMDYSFYRAHVWVDRSFRFPLRIRAFCKKRATEKKKNWLFWNVWIEYYTFVIALKVFVCFVIEKWNFRFESCRQSMVEIGFCRASMQRLNSTS